jgi:hypothetical protein
VPKETSIPVNKKTLKFVQEYRDEFGFKSLDEAVINAVRWARLFNYIDSEQRRSIQERLNDLEFRIEALEKSQK